MLRGTLISCTTNLGCSRSFNSSKGMHKQTDCAAAIAVLVALSASASAEISGDIVKIGVLNDMSGLYADIGGAGSVEAARMAIADFGGNVSGKKVVLISADHQNRPDVGSAIANQWFGNDGVDAIVDVPTSSVALAVQEVARNKNKVFLKIGRAS